MTVSDAPTLEPEVRPTQCGRCRGWFPEPHGHTTGTIAEWWLCPPCRDSLIIGPATGARGADAVVDDGEARFLRVATLAGYDEHSARQMLDAAEALPLPLDVAGAWLEGGFTPWAAEVWLRQGFDTPEEADRYRAMGLGAEAAYWLRFDGRPASAASGERP